MARDRAFPGPGTTDHDPEVEAPAAPGVRGADEVGDGLTDGDATVRRSPDGAAVNPAAGVVGGSGTVAGVVGPLDPALGDPEAHAGIESRVESERRLESDRPPRTDSSGGHP